MKVRVVLVSGIISFLLAAASFGGVTVTAEDGAKLRVDPAKFAKITENAIRRAAPDSTLNVAIVVSSPEVWLSPRPLMSGRPYPADAVPPGAEVPRDPQSRLLVFETVRARYTITGADGAMIESVPLVFDVGHGTTLEGQLKTMRATADYIAWRVAELTK